MGLHYRSGQLDGRELFVGVGRPGVARRSGPIILVRQSAWEAIVDGKRKWQPPTAVGRISNWGLWTYTLRITELNAYLLVIPGLHRCLIILGLA